MRSDHEKEGLIRIFPALQIFYRLFDLGICFVFFGNDLDVLITKVPVVVEVHMKIVRGPVLKSEPGWTRGDKTVGYVWGFAVSGIFPTAGGQVPFPDKCGLIAVAAENVGDAVRILSRVDIYKIDDKACMCGIFSCHQHPPERCAFWSGRKSAGEGHSLLCKSIEVWGLDILEPGIAVGPANVGAQLIGKNKQDIGWFYFCIFYWLRTRA